MDHREGLSILFLFRKYGIHPDKLTQAASNWPWRTQQFDLERCTLFPPKNPDIFTLSSNFGFLQPKDTVNNPIWPCGSCNGGRLKLLPRIFYWNGLYQFFPQFPSISFPNSLFRKIKGFKGLCIIIKSVFFRNPSIVRSWKRPATPVRS